MAGGEIFGLVTLAIGIASFVFLIRVRNFTKEDPFDKTLTPSERQSFFLNITNYDMMGKQCKCGDDIVNDFGADRNKIHLPNVNGKQTLPCNIDIEALQHDTYFREFLNGFAKYFFGDTTPAHILLWLRNDKKNDLICIYDGSEKPDSNHQKGKG